MGKLRARAVVMLAAAGWLLSADAAALLLEKGDDPSDPLDLTYFYPYPTTYTTVDPGYAFDDDPMTAIVPEPYTMPVVVERITARRSMVQLRRSFVPEMCRSTDAI